MRQNHYLHWILTPSLMLLASLALLVGNLSIAQTQRKLEVEQNHIIKPTVLIPNDKVMLIAAGHQINPDQLAFAIERMEALGLRVVIPSNILAQQGYFAGPVEVRAKAINNGFSDPDIKAIIAVRGGSGESLVIDKLDYELIRKNPKIIMGMSDVTALLLAIHDKTGLVTFHGPNAATYAWPKFTVDYVKAVLFDGETPTLKNPTPIEDDLIQTKDRITTINGGIAKGTIIGGNLTVITSLMGSDYLPQDWTGKILFLEDVGEAIYRIDRMFAVLENAGILNQIDGFIFGTCQKCPSLPSGGFELNQVIERYIKPLGIPAISGAMIGHQAKQFIIPIGLPVQLDADKGEITLLEPAVK